jgi:hypothetical protein
MIKQPEVNQFGTERSFVHLPFRKRLVYCCTTTGGAATGFQTQQLSYDFRAS